MPFSQLSTAHKLRDDRRGINFGEILTRFKLTLQTCHLDTAPSSAPAEASVPPPPAATEWQPRAKLGHRTQHPTGGVAGQGRPSVAGWRNNRRLRQPFLSAGEETTRWEVHQQKLAVARYFGRSREQDGGGDPVPGDQGARLHQGKRAPATAPWPASNHRNVGLLVWAMWQVFPHLTDVARKHKAKGLIVVGVTSESKAQVAGFVQQMGYGMDYVVALTLVGIAGVRGIPHAFVVGSDGRIKFSGHPMDPGFAAAVDKAVSESPPKQAPPPPSPITASREELHAMAIKELKQILRDRGVSMTGLAEKGDIVAKILETCTAGGCEGTSLSGASPSPQGGEEPAKPKNVVCEDGVCRVIKEEEGPPASAGQAAADALSHTPPDDGLGPDSDVSSFKVSELKAALKLRGVSIAGLAEKADLMQALRQALQA
eukprot:CAMPEP_0117692278 /NCGR_PEP_ID=MMETSP0804-20121206/26234_1 /TAXON_ID=1074897 /ORGANISM="Tetraselmis astigmatica, Strain CCMP880" /LENGTH=427 /DNA_ID=CAMNT_0005505699 /DNA_START=137 /DNA_END=1423 /DNA_ORIENTATION=+